jgi:hypothetical protein
MPHLAAAVGGHSRTLGHALCLFPDAAQPFLRKTEVMRRLRRHVAILLGIAMFAAAGGFGASGMAAHEPLGQASCGGATPLKVGGKLKLGPDVVLGFGRTSKCARVTLDCAPKLGGYQTRFVLNLPQPPATPIVIRGSSRSGIVKLFLVGTTGPAPKMPACLGSRGARTTATLEAPDITYVLVVFPPIGAASFRLTALEGGHQIGSAIIAIAAKR